MELDSNQKQYIQVIDKLNSELITLRQNAEFNLKNKELNSFVNTLNNFIRKHRDDLIEIYTTFKNVQFKENIALNSHLINFFNLSISLSILKINSILERNIQNQFEIDLKQFIAKTEIVEKFMEILQSQNFNFMSWTGTKLNE
jgi:hypothetical protein